MTEHVPRSYAEALMHRAHASPYSPDTPPLDDAAFAALIDQFTQELRPFLILPAREVTPLVKDVPDDTQLPLEEWNAKVDAMLAEVETMEQGRVTRV